MIFSLFTSLALAAAEQEEAVGFTLGEIWEHSGMLARGVIITLIVMVSWAVFVGIERLIAHQRARSQSMMLAAEVVSSLQESDITKALAQSNKEEYKSSYLAALLKAGLAELQERPDDYGVAAAKRALDKAASQEISKLSKGMTVLATVGSTAPFVGLFGTVFGVINAFQGMAQAGSGLAAISAGISEALITTGVGIGVAIVGVWLFNYFNQRTDKVSQELAASEAEFLDWATKLVLARQEKAGE
ncbi:MAG: MotA/TolQ/ExbB proton channel family protein [Deltaproteobacteria bacterium]|nr:MotA/TolQ/ExbB proton channel family protein [Deltaproteobacteria bacterium]